MATQGGTLSHGSERDEREDNASSAPPPRPVIPLWPWRTSALSTTAAGVAVAAAIWTGLAMLVSAYVYRMSAAAQITLAIAGGWLMAAGISYAVAARLRLA